MGARISGSGGSRFDLAQNAEINVTPFVDVMLVLLIIFMVAAPLATATLTEDGVREVVLPTGWVDVKVCAVDADWSGLKFLKRKG